MQLQESDREYQEGNVYHKKGNLPAARRHFSQAVKIWPLHIYAWTNLGIVLRELGEFDKSVEAHLEAIKVWDRARGHYLLGVTYQEAGDNPAAIQVRGWLDIRMTRQPLGRREVRSMDTRAAT